MSVDPTRFINVTESERNENSFRYQEEVVSGNGEWVRFPNGVNGATVDLIIPPGNSGHVEHTNEDVSGADPSSGITWPNGVVTADTSNYIKPVSAIRGVSNSGAVTIRILFQ